VKKTALALALVLTILVTFRAQLVKLAEANPWMPPSPPPYPAEPCQEFPMIKVNSPKNGEILAGTTAEIDFTVTKPNSWNYYWNWNSEFSNLAPFYRTMVGSYVVHIYLDGKWRGVKGDPGATGFPNADYSIVLDDLVRGNHNVSVVVAASTFYDDPESDSYLVYPRNITETRQFTTNADPPVPTPSPTPTPVTGPIPATLIFVASVGIALAVTGLLVSINRRKHEKNACLSRNLDLSPRV
jgi:hypothetical protein